MIAVRGFNKLAAAMVATVATGALLNACNNPEDIEEKPYVGPDTTQTDTTKVPDSLNLDTWKPLVQMYVMGYSLPDDNHTLREQDFGWHTIYSKDGEWSTTTLSTQVFMLMPNGQKSGVGPMIYGQICGKKLRRTFGSENEPALNVAYYTDGSKGCREVEVPENGTFVDSRDRKTYNKVTIGTQTWMGENLNYMGESFYDVPGLTSYECYNNNVDSCGKYGRLYDWNTALTVCPAGWHLPSDDEWKTLTDYADGELTAGGKLKSTSGWNNKDDGTSGNGTDEYDFSALPGGLRYDGNFDGAGYGGDWWSATEYDASGAWFRYMDYNNEIVYSLYSDKTSLFSVRCVQD